MLFVFLFFAAAARLLLRPTPLLPALGFSFLRGERNITVVSKIYSFKH